MIFFVLIKCKSHFHEHSYYSASNDNLDVRVYLALCKNRSTLNRYLVKELTTYCLGMFEVLPIVLLKITFFYVILRCLFRTSRRFEGFKFLFLQVPYNKLHDVKKKKKSHYRTQPPWKLDGTLTTELVIKLCKIISCVVKCKFVEFLIPTRT
jgi:hypothetical protein